MSFYIVKLDTYKVLSRTGYKGLNNFHVSGRDLPMLSQLDNLTENVWSDSTLVKYSNA